MDGFDLVAIAALMQAIVLAITLIVFALQFRAQTKAIKDAAYQSVLDDYNEVIRTLVNRPEMGSLLDDLVKTGPASALQMPQLSREEKIVRSHFLMIYGLLERVFILHDKKWIDEAEWQEWAAWLRVLGKNPIFGQVHTMSGGMFNASFQEHVSGVVASSAAATEGGRPGTPE